MNYDHLFIYISITSSHNSLTVVRWVMKSMVFCGYVLKRRRYSSYSVGSSRELLISSSRRMSPPWSSPRAMAIRWACPSLSPLPRSPSSVLMLSGRSKTKSAQAVCSTWRSSSSVASGFASCRL